MGSWNDYVVVDSSLRDVERTLRKITPFTQCMPGRHKDIDRRVISRAADCFVERPEGQRDGDSKANREALRDAVIRRAWNQETRCARPLGLFYKT